MKKTALFFLCCATFFSSCSNSKSDTFYSVPSNDKPYFSALRAERGNNVSEARRLFTKAAKKSSPYIARRASEKLTTLGSSRERAESCAAFLRQYEDEEALLFACRFYSDSEDYTKVIAATNSIDVQTAENQLVYLRFSALLKKGTVKPESLYSWYTSRSYSQWHYKFFCELSPDEQFATLQNVAEVISFRSEVYKKQYASAYANLAVLQPKLPLLPQIVSDLGKVCLFGSSDFYKNAVMFDGITKKLSGTEAEFYALFYAARLYAKTTDYFTTATNRFTSAMEAATTDRLYDNALWYLLDLNLKRSTDRGISMIKKYCSKWHDPLYFEDLFNTLTPIMLSEGKWNDFYGLYTAVDGFAPDSAVAKLAYIYGRLVQEKLALPVLGDTHNSEPDAAFSRALVSGDEPYYAVMAIGKLNLSGQFADDVLQELYAVRKTVEADSDAERLLLGLMASGFPEFIYEEWQRLYSAKKYVSLETGRRLVQFLYDCGKVRPEYNPQGLRMAVRVMQANSSAITKEDIKLIFPRCYEDILERKCRKYQIPSEIMYALVRSESFFDTNITSVAGANGLTQLMQPTAEDIAHRLKVNSFSLTNPDDNLEFGAYYIENLYSRLEKQWLPAFFAYNAGITRVRRWMRMSNIELGNPKKLPMDLFLETIPYDETRGYGRKLVSALSIYAWLYNDTDIATELKEILNP